MTSDPLYCIWLTNNCKPMADWGVYWTAAGSIAAIIFGIFGLYKIVAELKAMRNQRAIEISQREAQLEESKRQARLNRTEFFLDQHRRLFDNPDLFEILSLVDGDDEALAAPEMWDKKRKLLAFFEEIALLVRSDQLDMQVACYMFGYYVNCAVGKPNFSKGIDASRTSWGLLHVFAEQAADFLRENKDGPPPSMLL